MSDNQTSTLDADFVQDLANHYGESVRPIAMAASIMTAQEIARMVARYGTVEGRILADRIRSEYVEPHK